MGCRSRSPGSQLSDIAPERPSSFIRPPRSSSRSSRPPRPTGQGGGARSGRPAFGSDRRGSPSSSGRPTGTRSFAKRRPGRTTGDRYPRRGGAGSGDRRPSTGGARTLAGARSIVPTTTSRCPTRPASGGTSLVEGRVRLRRGRPTGSSRQRVSPMTRIDAGRRVLLDPSPGSEPMDRQMSGRTRPDGRLGRVRQPRGRPRGAGPRRGVAPRSRRCRVARRCRRRSPPKSAMPPT